MESRKRLRPWLWKHTDAGDYGLRWINKEEGMFRIPWMHKHNRSWRQERFQVFKEWAKFTNRYNEGDEDDFPGWKTRLRTALTKLSKDFEEIHELHNLEDDEDPYKVYRFKKIENQKDTLDSYVSSSASSPSASQSSDVSQWSPLSNPSPFPHLNLSQRAEMGNIPNIIEADDSRDFLSERTDENALAEVNCGQSIVEYLGGKPGTQQNIPITTNEDTYMRSLPSDLCSLNSDNLVEKLPSSEITPILELLEAKPVSRKPKIAYEIRYLDEVMKTGYLYDDTYHFYFGEIPSDEIQDQLSPIVLGPKDSERIDFPDISKMKRRINASQRKCFEKILMQMDRGFLLRYYEDDIYAQRLCRTRMFATSPTMSNCILDRQSPDPKKVFDFTQFRKNHLGDNRKSPFTILTFAQEYKMESFRTLMMHIKLIHLGAEELLPNSNTDSLQISDLNSGDRELIQKVRQLDIQDGIGGKVDGQANS